MKEEKAKQAEEVKAKKVAEKEARALKAALEKEQKKELGSKAKVARQIDCKLTTGLFTMREAMQQPTTLHLPPAAIASVNAKLAALEDIQKQARLVIIDASNNELPP